MLNGGGVGRVWMEGGGLLPCVFFFPTTLPGVCCFLIEGPLVAFVTYSHPQPVRSQKTMTRKKQVARFHAWFGTVNMVTGVI